MLRRASACARPPTGVNEPAHLARRLPQCRPVQLGQQVRDKLGIELRLLLLKTVLGDDDLGRAQHRRNAWSGRRNRGSSAGVDMHGAGEQRGLMTPTPHLEREILGGRHVAVRRLDTRLRWSKRVHIV